jgi:hypothetical protein
VERKEEKRKGKILVDFLVSDQVKDVKNRYKRKIVVRK